MNVTSSDEPMVSVIICTRDRADDLARCLPTVLANEYPDFEVIVVDQSSTDATQRVVDSAVFTAREQGREWESIIVDEGASEATDRLPDTSDPSAAHRLVYYRMTTVGLSRGRNEGIRYARGEIMASTDDDCTVPRDWLRRATTVLAQEPEAGIVFGAATAAPHDPSKTFLPAFRPPRYLRLQGRFARVRAQALGGANMVVRRAVFEQVGGFDECLGAGCLFRSGEDDDLAYRALRAGIAVVLDPVNAIVHWGKRDYANGSARRLLRNHFYGNGARLIKCVRYGDPLAAYSLLALALKETAYLASNLLRHRRASGAGRLWYLILGAVRGLRQPLDRKHWVYVPTTHERA